MKRRIFLFLVFTLIFFSVLVSAQPSGSEILDSIISEVETIIVSGLKRVLTAVIKIAKVTYIVMGIAGVLMWASGYAVSRGKQLIIGAIIIAVLLEALSGVI